jgi:hypothetical protein
MNFLKAFLIALVGSVAVNVIIVSFVGPMVLTPGQHLTALTLMPVVMFTVIGTIGATIVYAIIRALMALYLAFRRRAYRLILSGLHDHRRNERPFQWRHAS